jgi:hypothetical protein
MRKTAIIFAVLLMAASVQADDLKDAGLLGKVKSVDTSTFGLTMGFGQWVQDRTSTSRMVRSYDAAGNMAGELDYDIDGSLTHKWVVAYEYDAMGNWTKQTTSREIIESGVTSVEPQTCTTRTSMYYE